MPVLREFTDEELIEAPVAEGNLRGVPVLDITALVQSGEKGLPFEHPLIRQIVKACEEWGFFQVVGHGISEQLMEKTHRQMEAFFRVHKELKRTMKRTVKNSRGFADDELTKQKVDWKELLDIGAQDGSMDKSGLDGWNQWPTAQFQLPEFEPTVREWFAACRHLSCTLVGAMAVGLGLDNKYLLKDFDEHTSFVRFNYYPVCPRPDKHKAISHHTDAGAVTVLSQSEVKSLQVFHRLTGTWYEVPPIKNAFVINTGDVFQVWSNDGYQAPIHRVKARSDAERWSSAFFLNPNYSSNYAPLPTTVSAARPAMYKPINWGEFRMKRFAGDYADVGEETQIAHYKVKRVPPAARM